ncbi:MAG: hypothetical protein ABIE25_07910 [Thermoplasmatota archaeon]
MKPLTPVSQKTAVEYFAFVVIAVASFLTRLYPLSISPYPFNNDSITECEIASEILGSGHLNLPSISEQGTHSMGIPVFNVLIAYFSAAIGVPPLECAQFIVAVAAVATIGGLYLLARIITSSFLGGFTAGFMGVMLGTFVYTTGSVWKEALGITFMVLALLTFVGRSRPRNRALMFIVLMILPLTHHLVSAVTLLALTLSLAWSWYIAITDTGLKRRHWLDLLTVGVPAVWMVAYYQAINFDSSTLVSSQRTLALAPILFLMLCALVIAILSKKSHWRFTFAPAIGLGLSTLLLLDYYGYLFPYKPAAPALFNFLLAGAIVFLFSLAWYGTEIIIERRPVHRAIQLCVLLSPLAIMGVAMLGGLSSSSHKVFYRTFDFLDLAILIGAGAALVSLYGNRRKAYVAIGSALIVASIVSFPYGYESSSLLGVRHDTQPFEMDALVWVSRHNEMPNFFSDERISYVAHALYGGYKNSYLPECIMTNRTLSPNYFYVVEESWATIGVNDYPRGTVVIPSWNYTRTTSAADTVFIGGPVGDRIQIFTASGLGAYFVYGV